MAKEKLSSLWLLIVLSQPAAAQTTTFGHLTLLPGYQVERIPHVDVAIGKIYNTQGSEFYCSFGMIANPLTRSEIEPEREPEPVKWRKEQEIAGWTVQAALTTRDELIVVYLAKGDRVPWAMIRGRVRSIEEATDLLLMASTIGLAAPPVATTPPAKQ